MIGRSPPGGQVIGRSHPGFSSSSSIFKLEHFFSGWYFTLSDFGSLGGLHARSACDQQLHWLTS